MCKSSFQEVTKAIMIEGLISMLLVKLEPTIPKVWSNFCKLEAPAAKPIITIAVVSM